MVGIRLVFVALLACAAAAWSQAPQPALPGKGPAGTANPAPAPGRERFAFAYNKGDKFKVLSEVDEDVYLDRRLAHRAQILNRIAFEIADADPDGSWGLVRGTFDTSERGGPADAYLVSATYDSEFRRDRLGRYTIDARYYMPVVRDVPVFPERDLAPGDTWTAAGEERHDLRRVFGIPDPYAIPFQARYRYEGPVQKDGSDLRLITVSYTIFFRPPPPRAYERIFPVQISGYSDQKVYWDPGQGQPVAYEERFDLLFDWSDGATIEYRGSARSRVTESELMDKPGLQEDAEKALEGLDDVTVAATDEGVMISLDNLQFEPDSAKLKDAELEKLSRIAELLKRYTDRDVLVGGHAAKAGYAEGRKKVSEDRARAVAERLIALGAGKADRIRAVGFGDERPLADNATEAGRARNRRVEITILEN